MRAPAWDVSGRLCRGTPASHLETHGKNTCSAHIHSECTARSTKHTARTAHTAHSTHTCVPGYPGTHRTPDGVPARRRLAWDARVCAASSRHVSEEVACAQHRAWQDWCGRCRGGHARTHCRRTTSALTLWGDVCTCVTCVVASMPALCSVAGH